MAGSHNPEATLSIQSRLIDYEGGGTVLEGLLAWDDTNSEPRPGVMVSHAWAAMTNFLAEIFG